MTLNEQLSVLNNSDRLKILKGGQLVYAGWTAFVNGTAGGPEKYSLSGQEVVKKLKIETEIRHKKWKELGLMPPLSPDQVPCYSFSDLRMEIYIVISV